MTGCMVRVSHENQLLVSMRFNQAFSFAGIPAADQHLLSGGRFLEELLQHPHMWSVGMQHRGRKSLKALFCNMMSRWKIQQHFLVKIVNLYYTR